MTAEGLKKSYPEGDPAAISKKQAEANESAL
jgi:hypothetical protein